MKTLALLSALIITTAANAQIISSFTWASNPLTAAAAGPNGTSASTSAVSQFVGGAIGYAINPGLPTKNVDLVIPGSPYFDVNGIDIELYFRREESVASFWKRGSMFNFGMNNGWLTVTFNTTQGSTPGNLAINSGNIIAVADDHQFHNYRFRYDNNTGVANVWVDNAIVYTYNGVAGRPLSWTSAGNVVIGDQMDATSKNIPVLANLTVKNVTNAVLPVKLLSFKGAEKNNEVALEWTSTNETSFSTFIIERSANGNGFRPIGTIAAKGGENAVARYQFTDESAVSGSNFYRLKMVDADGSFKYSEVIKTSGRAETVTASCFPNPAKSFVNVVIESKVAGTYDYSVSTLQGNMVKASVASVGTGAQQVKIDLGSGIPAGVLIIRLHNRQTNDVQSFRIVKS